MAKKEPITHCENCGTELRGEFCHVCGQKAVELRRPVIGLAQDIIVETLSIDSRLFRTLAGLLLNPGKVAKSYIQGHRVRYTPPFRIFLFFSLVFFATLFLIINTSARQGDVNVQAGPANFTVEDDSDDQSSVVSEFVEGFRDGAGLDEPDASNSVSADGEGNTAGANETENSEQSIDETDEPTRWEDVNYNGPAWLEGIAKRGFENIQQVQEDPRLFFANVRDNIPRVLFLLPIIYPLLLLIFYFYKKNTFVYDLLIISLYMHAALYFYLFLSVVYQASPLDKMPVLGMGDVFIQLWGVFQSYRVLAVNFATKWWAVMIKGTVINVVYWTVTGILVATGMALSLFF